MIRPVTCVCFLLACGSGLYVYQSKHRVQLIDRDIERTVRATDALREQTRVAHAEWTLLNDPQRLQLLADQFLKLKNVAPGQFTSMAELDNRLPAVTVPEPEPTSQDPLAVPVAEPPPPVAVVPPLAPAKPVAIAAAPTPPHVPEHKILPLPHQAAVETTPAATPPRQVVAEAAPAPTPARPQSPVFRPVVAADPPRPAPPRIVRASLPAQPPPGPVVGSALGMARGGSPPPPQPMPVSASQWVTNGGGG
jgi:hypothetical protein